ncbi:MAG TPA: 2-hydroxyacyl-CoA dehydratase [Candidatus Limivivens intestinipullorum]|uniref:2-hydroxyacyl-CoA dehydratase n=1 Tax=Candidatus Limivivens intestinipullorum TaxID=2840858 RepID=A0A9D1EV73_9FIRM|nr:2-hydroxyacyl-CoA dehydratase [Candidatus Limivivens intestinipullorum]
MWIADKYIDYVKEQTQEKPGETWDKMLLGFKANKLRMKLLPKKGLAKGYQKLEAMMMSFVADSLGRPDSYVWGNIFSPCEIMHSIGLSTLSIECLSCYFSGYHLEDYFIDYAQNTGIAPTLCSYHKTFVGAIDSGAVPVPEYAVTTSLSCDGNLNTFRYLEKKKGVPFTFLDVPYGDDEASVDYLAAQLRSFAEELAGRFGKTFREEELREVLRIENETREELLKFLRLQSERYYPGEMISHLYMMMGTHLLMGTKEFLELVRFMNEDIKTYPKLEGKKIFWVHLLPFYQETLQKYLNCNPDYQIIASDIIIDSMEKLDPEHPFHALAKKIIRNLYNGSYSHKADMVANLADMLKPGAVIQFCHWGCKQSSGGSLLLKERMQEMGIPMLILDGDGIDRRNSHDGQIKTRLEAFLEMLDSDQSVRKIS